MHHLAYADLLLYPADELRTGKLPRRPNRAPPTLDRRCDVAQVDVQPQLPDLPHCLIASRA